jgi:hypothetical protein
VADPPLVSRRAVLLGAAATGVLAACGGGGGDGSADDTGAALPSTNLIALFAPQGVLVTGPEQRFTLALADAEGVPLETPPAELEFTVRQDGAAEGVPVTAQAHAEGLPTAYYPVRFTFDQPGLYDVTTTIDGETLEPRVFEVGTEGTIPAVGQALPPVETPTTADAQGVDPICTRSPACPFHDVTLTEALSEGRPVAFLVATPEFCQTALCGPVLDILVDAAPDAPGIRMIHSEVYANPREVDDILQAELSPAMQAYGMTFEPCLWVTDASGTVVARLDNIYDRTELLDVLGSVS